MTTILENIKFQQEQAMKINHPKWDPNRYERSSQKFEDAYAKKRREYLMNLPDIDALSLPKDDLYDRLRWKGEELPAYLDPDKMKEKFKQASEAHRPECQILAFPGMEMAAPPKPKTKPKVKEPSANKHFAKSRYNNWMD